MMILRLLTILTSILATTPAHASWTDEFYTYGGHDLVVSAFNKVGLIFSSNDFQSFFSVFATASLAGLIIRIFFGVAMGSKDLHGINVATGALFPWLITCALFMALVIPKGTLHIYDPVENKYQAVGGIPDIIVLFASVTNKIERAFVEMVSTSGDPVGFLTQAGGKGFMGLEKLATNPLQGADPLLDESVRAYVKDCIILEASQHAGFIKELKSDTTDLMQSMSKAQNPASFTTIFDPALSPQGEAMSCTAAWVNISTRIKAEKSLDNNLFGVCAEMGYDPFSSTALSDCQARMSGIVVAMISDKTSQDFLKTAYLAQAMDKVFSDDQAADGFANYTILNKASGTMSTVNNWLPTVRVVILAVTIALIPFLSLLMLTPAMPKAAKFLFGSFAFLSIWGTTDAILHQFIIDYANRTYAEVRQYNLGLDAIRFFPSCTEKILAMFGMVRASGLALSAYIASNVVGMGASIGAAVGGKLMGEVTATGSQAASQMLDLGSKAATRRNNQMALPTETLANNYSFQQRTTADYAHQMAQLESTLGGLSETGGLKGWGKLHHNQGATNAYRAQGDIALNKQFMAQAEAMGIPKEQAQKIAAATVNHGEGFAELLRLQKQGYSGQEAADTYWQGKIVDHMQNRSVGQEDGFTLTRPAVNQETGRWGQISATWQNGQLAGLQGNTVSIVDTDSIRAGYDKSFGQALSEVRKAEQSVGEGITRSWGNSATYSQVQAAAQQLYTATSGTVDWSKSLNSSVVSSLRNSTAVDERTGKTVDQSAWAQITAGAGTPSVSPIKANIEGGASWRVTTSDGKSYTVHQSSEQARSTQEQIGQSWRTTSTQVRSGNYSSTAQKAVAQIESVTGTQTANESASRSYQLAHDINERKNEALSRAAETRTSLDRDFYSYVGQQQFGGGASGDRQAIKHLEALSAAGKTAEINQLKEQYFTARGISAESLGQSLPQVSKPDQQAINQAVQPVDAKIQTQSHDLHQNLASQPAIKLTDPSAQVASQLKAKTGGVEPKAVEKDIAGNAQRIESGKQKITNKGLEIKQSPVEQLHAAAAEAGRKSGEATLKAADAWNNSVPGQVTNGLAGTVPKIRDGLNSLSSANAPAQSHSNSEQAKVVSEKPQATPPKGGL